MASRLSGPSYLSGVIATYPELADPRSDPDRCWNLELARGGGAMASDRQIFDVSMRNCWLWWRHLQYQTFEPSADLFAALVETDPRDLLCGEFGLPHAAFAVRVPPGFWNLPDLVRGEGRSDVDLVLCVRRNLPMIRAGRVYGPEDPVWALPTLDLILCSAGGQVFSSGVPPEAPGMTVGEWLSTALLSGVTILQKMRANPEQPAEPSDSDGSIEVDVRAFLVNLSLWLASSGSRVRRVGGNPKRDARDRRRGRAAKERETRWFVGADVRISADVLEAAREAASTIGARSPTFALRRRTLVRGHWRNQACGAGRLLRRRIWIKPHVRNADAAELLVRTYRDA